MARTRRAAPAAQQDLFGGTRVPLPPLPEPPPLPPGVKLPPAPVLPDPLCAVLRAEPPPAAAAAPPARPEERPASSPAARRTKPVVLVETAAHAAADRARALVVESGRRMAARGWSLSAAEWGVGRSGRAWKPLAPEAPRGCGVAAFLIDRAVEALPEEKSPRASFARALGTVDRDADAFVCGFTWDGTRPELEDTTLWSDADHRWNAWVAAGATAAHELGLR